MLTRNIKGISLKKNLLKKINSGECDYYIFETTWKVKHEIYLILILKNPNLEQNEKWTFKF